MGGNKALLTTGKVEHVIIKLTLPMILGNLGMVIFNLVDTYFIAKLGTQQLAALSFTFPVVLVVNSLALGLGVATSSLVSNAVGEGNHYKVKRLGTDSILLSLLLVILFVLFGLATIEPIFQMLGATSEIMPYIKEYMSIWYLGVIFVVVPMVGNSILRALKHHRSRHHHAGGGTAKYCIRSTNDFWLWSFSKTRYYRGSGRYGHC